MLKPQASRYDGARQSEGRLLRAFVTGAAGFIGSNLVEALIAAGCSVTGWDNLSTGFLEFLRPVDGKPFQLVQGDNANLAALTQAMAGADIVFHLAANADVRFGTDHPERDLKENTIATFNVLEAMRANRVRRLIFSSTGSVYGEATVFPTPENAPFPVQTSLYGASKLAGEGLISDYCAGFGIDAVVLRFVSILGPRYTHGHVFDFYRQLRCDPTLLSVLGDGHQRKSYLHVADCVDAIVSLAQSFPSGFSVFNLGVDEYCEVRDSIRWICDELNVSPTLRFSGGDRGWVGDNPFIFLDCTRIRQRGWKPKYAIESGIRATLNWLREHPWVLDRRTSHD